MSLLKPFRSLARKVEAFDDDEEGMETIQVVMLLGVAAVVAALIFIFWKKIKGWFKGREAEFDQNSSGLGPN